MTRLLAILVWLGLGVSDARAQGADEQARVLYTNGKMLYEEGRYEDAIAAFERAYTLSPSRSLLLYNIANAKERVGDWRGALDALNRYRAFAPLSERATLERRIRNIEYRLKAVESIVEQMERPPPKPEFQPDRVRAVPGRPGPESPPMEKATRWRMGTSSVVMYSIAGLGSVAGSVFAFQAEQARQEAVVLCSTGDAVFCPATAKPSLDRDRIFSWLTDGSFALAGASAITGTVIMVVAKKKHGRQNLMLSLNGVSLSGRF